MVSLLRTFPRSCRNQRMVSLIAAVCILCCATPSTAIYANADTITNATEAEDARIIERFDRFEQSNPTTFEEGRMFLRSFISELNAKHGLSLTLDDACKLVRDNLHALQIPLEMQDVLLVTIDSLESVKGQVEISHSFESLAADCHPHKKSKKKESKDRRKKSPVVMGVDVELPGNCYVGAVEIFAGALVCILPFPGTAALGLAIMGDGARRVIDGVIEVSDQRRNDPNYVPPKLGPPFD